MKNKINKKDFLIYASYFFNPTTISIDLGISRSTFFAAKKADGKIIRKVEKIPVCKYKNLLHRIRKEKYFSEASDSTIIPFENDDSFAYDMLNKFKKIREDIDIKILKDLYQEKGLQTLIDVISMDIFTSNPSEYYTNIVTNLEKSLLGIWIQSYIIKDELRFNFRTFKDINNVETSIEYKIDKSIWDNPEIWDFNKLIELDVFHKDTVIVQSIYENQLVTVYKEDRVKRVGVSLSNIIFETNGKYRLEGSFLEEEIGAIPLLSYQLSNNPLDDLHEIIKSGNPGKLLYIMLKRLVILNQKSK